MVAFRRYGKVALGPCRRGACGGAPVTGSVWSGAPDDGGRFLLSCDNEACLAEAVRLVEEGKGV